MIESVFIECHFAELAPDSSGWKRYEPTGMVSVTYTEDRIRKVWQGPKADIPPEILTAAFSRSNA